MLPALRRVLPPRAARTLAGAFALGVMLAALSSGCTRATQPNILFVLIDTLRADRLGAAHPDDSRTPFLDTLAAHGFVFRNAYAQTSWTSASVASLFTSRYQSQHHVMSFWAKLSEDEVTLAELLGGKGYATAAFVANFLLRPDLGYGQGFQQYQVFSRNSVDPRGRPVPIKGSAEQVDAAALAWLDEIAHSDQRRAPFFLYLHYMEPHAPYDPPARFLDKVLAGKPHPDLEEVNRRARVPNFGTFSDALVADIISLYDAEVMSIDDQLRQLFSTLQTRGSLRDTVVVITADHGEEFREHGTMGHHQALFEESIRVPLIILVPGHEDRVDIDAIVSLTDLAPTLLDLAGIARPPSFRGTSLTGLMGLHEGTPGASEAGRRVAFSELIKETTDRRKPHEHAVITDRDKLILGVDGEHEYYDLRTDPGETNPDALAAERRAQLSEELGTLLSARQDAATPAAERTVDPETLERMRALGYHP